MSILNYQLSIFEGGNGSFILFELIINRQGLECSSYDYFISLYGTERREMTNQQSLFSIHNNHLSIFHKFQLLVKSRSDCPSLMDIHGRPNKQLYAGKMSST